MNAPSSPSPSSSASGIPTHRMDWIHYFPRAVLGVLLAVGLAYLLYQSSFILLGAFGGVLIAATLLTLGRWVGEHTPLPVGPAMGLIAVFSLACGAGLILWIAPSLVEQIRQMSDEIPKAVKTIQDWVRSIGVPQDVLAKLSLGELFSPAVLKKMAGVVSTTLSALAGALFVSVVGLYLAAQPNIYVEGTARLFPIPRRNSVRSQMDSLRTTLSWWVLSRFLSMLVVGALTFVGLLAINMPFALGLAVIAAALSFIPNLGPILSFLPAVVLAIPQGGNQVLWVLGIYGAVQLVESYLITPFIAQKTVHLPPALLIVFQVAMGVVAGALGLLFAAPILAVMLFLIRTNYVEEALEGSQAQ